MALFIWMIVRNTTIRGCTFRNLSALFDDTRRNKQMIVLKDSKLEKTLFTEIQIQGEIGVIGFIFSSDTDIKECIFTDVKMDHGIMIGMFSGRIHNCKMKNCDIVHWGSIIDLEAEAMEYDNERIGGVGGEWLYYARICIKKDNWNRCFFNAD